MDQAEGMMFPSILNSVCPLNWKEVFLQWPVGFQPEDAHQLQLISFSWISVHQIAEIAFK